MSSPMPIFCTGSEKKGGGVSGLGSRPPAQSPSLLHISAPPWATHVDVVQLVTGGLRITRSSTLPR